jgi:hypothetical protein
MPDTQTASPTADAPYTCITATALHINSADPPFAIMAMDGSWAVDWDRCCEVADWGLDPLDPARTHVIGLARLLRDAAPLLREVSFDRADEIARETAEKWNARHRAQQAEG